MLRLPVHLRDRRSAIARASRGRGDIARPRPDNGLVPRPWLDRNPTYPTDRAIITICDMQYVMGRANAIFDMRIRYGPREYDMRYANRLRAMSNCKVAFSAIIPTDSSSTFFASALAKTMEDDGTSIDREPVGSVPSPRY